MRSSIVGRIAASPVPVATKTTSVTPCLFPAAPASKRSREERRAAPPEAAASPVHLARPSASMNSPPFREKKPPTAGLMPRAPGPERGSLPTGRARRRRSSSVVTGLMPASGGPVSTSSSPTGRDAPPGTPCADGMSVASARGCSSGRGPAQDVVLGSCRVPSPPAHDSLAVACRRTTAPGLLPSTICHQSASPTKSVMSTYLPRETRFLIASTVRVSSVQSAPNQLHGQRSTPRPRAEPPDAYRDCTAGSHVPGAQRKPKPVGIG
mmetsp:Transcript_26750/g.86391  ORF Transcript_26750/g.86391 Transcript_26750/m.86391 type:complete len:266 (+) Transcript_26750:1278-2075(+)